MAFEDKMDQLRNSLNSNPVTNERPAPRVSKVLYPKNRILLLMNWLLNVLKEKS